MHARKSTLKYITMYPDLPKGPPTKLSRDLLLLYVPTIIYSTVWQQLNYFKSVRCTLHRVLYDIDYSIFPPSIIDVFKINRILMT